MTGYQSWLQLQTVIAAWPIRHQSGNPYTATEQITQSHAQSTWIAQKKLPESLCDWLLDSREWSGPAFSTSGIGDLLLLSCPFWTGTESSASSNPARLFPAGTAGCTNSASASTLSFSSSIKVGGSTAVGVSRAAHTETYQYSLSQAQEDLHEEPERTLLETLNFIKKYCFTHESW